MSIWGTQLANAIEVKNPFLRGHSVEALKRDIDVPRGLAEKWLSAPRYDNAFRDNLKRVYTYRKQVLAIFEELVHSEQNRSRLQ